MKHHAHRTCLVASLLVLAGCTSVPYPCPLSTSASGSACAPMQDIYEAAKADKGQKYADPVENVFDTNAVQRALRERAAGLRATEQAPAPLAGTPTIQAPVTGMPVWQQPSVHRAWVRPHVDANGNLFGGGYVYYTTPGSWGAGTLGSEKPGAALFGPAPAAGGGAAAQRTPQAQPGGSPAPAIGGQGGPALDTTGRPPLPPSSNTGQMGPSSPGSDAAVMNLKQ